MRIHGRGSNRSRGVAAALSLLAGVAWTPAQAWAWIPQSVPAPAIATGGSEWLYGGSGPVAGVPLVDIDRQLAGQVSQPAMAFSQPKLPSQGWMHMGNLGMGAQGYQLFGMDWMYWAAAATTGVVLLLAKDSGGSSSTSGPTSGGSSPAPVPEPGSIWVFAAGALILSWFGRRRLLAAVRPGSAPRD